MTAEPYRGRVNAPTTPSGARTAGTVVVSTLLALTGSLCLPPTIAQAVATPCRAGTPILGDYNGDGIPEALVGQVLADGHDSSDQRYWRVGPDGSRTQAFRGALAVRNADLNGDVCSDLVATSDGVRIMLGSPSGLRSEDAIELAIPQASGLRWDEQLHVAAVGLRHDGLSQVVVSGNVVVEDEGHGRPFVDIFTLDATGVPGKPQVIAGSSVGARDCCSTFFTLDGSGRSFAIGSPGDPVGGAVYIFSADAKNRRKLNFRLRLTQASPRIPGTPEEDDGFGESVALRDGRLAIGVPGEGIGKKLNVGAIQPVVWHEATGRYDVHRQIHQGTAGVVGTNETEDKFGSVVVVTRGLTAKGSYDIAIGTPMERVGSEHAAGSVTVANFSKKLFRTYTQNTKGVPGVAEWGDVFGDTLATLPTSRTVDTLLIGAPGEDGVCTDAGSVLRTDGRPLSGSTAWKWIPPPACSDGKVFYWGKYLAR